jgi:hypothetical protein
MSQRNRSRIFTDAEYDELMLRLSGKKENYRIWYRVKPRIREMLDIWFAKKEKLEKLIS